MMEEEALVDKSSSELESRYFEYRSREAEALTIFNNTGKALSRYLEIGAVKEFEETQEKHFKCRDENINYKIKADYILEILKGRNDEFKTCSKDDKKVFYKTGSKILK